MPILKGKKTEYDVQTIVAYLERVCNEHERIFVILEKSYVRPVCGKRASFNLGYGYGMMQAILETLRLSYQIITPQQWQKNVLKGLDKDTKVASVMFCKRKWPKDNFLNDRGQFTRATKPSDGITDSLCMALYGKRLQNGN
jgi:hypothetical protein